MQGLHELRKRQYTAKASDVEALEELLVPGVAVEAILNDEEVVHESING